MARAIILLAGLTSISAAALAAQSSDTINVIARKPEEVRQEAKEFVRKVAVANRPVARFIDPVCPMVIGVSTKIADQIETRLRAIAKDAGVRLGKRGCPANLTVAFAKDTNAVIDEVANRTPGMFEEVGPSYLGTLKRSDAPIRWWHTSADRTTDGMRTGGNDAPPAVFGRQEQPGGTPLGGQVYQQYRPSFLSTQMVRALTSATIVIDVDRATGIPLDSVAAFAGLVGLAEVRFDDEPPENSILNMYAKDGPRDLTPLDTTFLRTLYRLPLDRTAIAHRGLLIRGIIGGDLKKRDQ
jgi:hypothetical protein